MDENKFQAGDRVVITDADKSHAPRNLNGLTGKVRNFSRTRLGNEGMQKIYNVTVDNVNWEFYEDCIDFLISEADVAEAIKSIKEAVR